MISHIIVIKLNHYMVAMKFSAISITTVFFIIIMFFPSFASNPMEDMAIEDGTNFNAWELGLIVKEEYGTKMLGSPASKNYDRWLKNVQGISPKHLIINNLSRIIHTVRGHVIIREVAYIDSDIPQCMEFIQRELMAIALLIKNQSLLKNTISYILGKIQIYGIDNPDVREELKKYWRTQEIKILGQQLGLNVKFDLKEQQ